VSVGGVKGGEAGSHVPFKKEMLLLRSSGGGVRVSGKHELHDIGVICVQKTVVGPWNSQKWARDILGTSQLHSMMIAADPYIPGNPL